ncbi:MAG: hypothetical protein P8L85_19670 [Rubripirellula sp.]|nr:hypothetical protein [Rubripirellula sp.]
MIGCRKSLHFATMPDEPPSDHGKYPATMANTQRPWQIRSDHGKYAVTMEKTQ